ncbi:MAG: hypothetical protein IKZ87_05565, partial [Actinomycetaceae bacterium]|nr:hypothetical protein [Actinomycetaceae bacterium]
SGSADVKPLNQNIYQGVWVKASALVANSTQFSPSAVSGNPVWTRNAQVKHLNSLARSMASTEWARVQKDYNTKQAAVTAAQTRVNAAWDKVDAAQIKVDSLQPLKRQEIYRLYHPSTGEHLYTTDANERDVLKTKHGWKYEGVAWASTTWSKKAVYRLFHPVSGDHHYTADLNEVKVLSTSHGWRREGIKWYSDDAQGKAVYRVFHSGLRVGQHHYTLDAHEVSVLTTKHGWKYEGVAWYGAK